MRVFKNGIRTDVIIDDYFPVSISTNLPSLFMSSPNEIWLPAVVKVLAKLHGSYAALANLGPDVIFRDLTGMPSEFIDLT
jgi:hypothetical protein